MVKESRKAGPRQLDIIGALLITGSLVLIVLIGSITGYLNLRIQKARLVEIANGLGVMKAGDSNDTA